ncbi:MAG: hypothetical protein PVH41_06700 [Anaerolineae bacterium]
MGPKPGCDCDFSLVAILRAGSSVPAQLTDQFGNGVGGYGAVIDCHFVSVNEAWASGWTVHGTWFGVDVTGWPVGVRVRDNGLSASDTCEQQPDLLQLCFPEPQPEGNVLG